MTNRDYYPPSINDPIVDEILSGRQRASVLQVDRSSMRPDEVRVVLEVQDDMTPMNGSDGFMGISVTLRRHKVLVSEYVWDRLMKATHLEQWFSRHDAQPKKFNLTIDTG